MLPALENTDREICSLVYTVFVSALLVHWMKTKKMIQIENMENVGHLQHVFKLWVPDLDLKCLKTNSILKSICKKNLLFVW